MKTNRQQRKDEGEGFAAFIGMDWADQKHDVCLMGRRGDSESFVINQRPEALQEWHFHHRALDNGGIAGQSFGLRDEVHEFAGESVCFCPWAGAYYQQQLRKGNSHHQALRSLAFKWIRVIYRCWQNRT